MLDAIHTILDILLPRRCPMCGNIVYGRETFLCAKCLLTSPFVKVDDIRDNKLTRVFWHLIPIDKGWYMMHYTPDNSLILNPKFLHDIYTAIGVGKMIAERLPEGFLNDIDIILPMPSTRKRIARRGMNHICVEAEAMVKAIGLNIRIATKAVERKHSKRSQIGLNPIERRHNVLEGDFVVRRPDELNGKHILLMDDVMTTGTTLLTLATAIMRRCHDVRFSILVTSKAGDRH